MLISTVRRNPALLHATALAAFLMASAPNNMATLAQGLDAEGAIDAIVGSDVTTGEENAAADEARIVAAIEATPANVSEVRKKFNLDKVEIIFVPDADGEAAVSEKIAEFEPEIAELRQEIEGSAMLYHAIDSRSVLMRDVVAIEFDDANGATIFVNSRDPQQ